MEPQKNNKIVIIGFVLILLVGMYPTFSFGQQIESNPSLVINIFNNSKAPLKAIEYYNTLPNQIKTNDLIQKSIAGSYLVLEDYKQAANLYIGLVDNSKLDVNYELAQCYANLNKPDLAVLYLQKHLQSKVRHMQREIKSNRAFLPIENSTEWKQLWQSEWYDKYDLMYEEAWFEYENQHFEEALVILNELNRTRQSLIDAYYLKAHTYMELNEHENALIAINTAIDSRDKNPVYYNTKAMVELSLNKPNKAFNSINKALSLDSSIADFYFTRSRIYLQQGNIPLAKVDLNELMNLMPSNEIYKLAGDIYFEAKEYQSAIKAYNNCLTLEKYNYKIYILRADSYAQIYAYEYAEQDYTMALDYDPNNGELYYKRGMVRKLQHKTDAACSDFEKAYRFKYMKADNEIRSYCQQKQ